MRTWIVLVLVALSVTVGVDSRLDAQTQATRAEVFVLGTFHMANPGRDAFNVAVDDVLVPKRQREVAELIDVLKRFRPTKVAIESGIGGPRPAQYADYIAGKHELSRNEIEQIGFRIAKELGHRTIYPVDASGDFPLQRVTTYANGTGRSRELDDILRGFEQAVRSTNEQLAGHTLLETLQWLNGDEQVSTDIGVYYRLAHIGESGDWPGADLVADWFRRNIRIFSNIVGLADSASERLLVIYGSGHLGWLRQAIASDPSLRLRTLAEFR